MSCSKSANFFLLSLFYFWTVNTDMVRRCTWEKIPTGLHTKGPVINYEEGGGGGYKMGKSWVRNLLRPHLSRQGKTCCASLEGGENLLRTPASMAKT